MKEIDKQYGRLTEHNVLDLATRRKTSRIFKKEKPPIDDLFYALEAARQAPSGSNLQPTIYILIEDTEIRAKLRAASEEGEKKFYDGLTSERKTWYVEKGLSWRKPNLEEAPYLLVVVADTSKANYFASAWVSVAYTLLALEERGLSTVTYTPSNPTLVGRRWSFRRVTGDYHSTDRL